MRNFKEAIEDLGLTSISKLQLKSTYPEPRRLMKLVENMENKVDTAGIVKATINLDELLPEVKRQFKQKQAFYTKKEQANIPFLLFRDDVDRSLFEYMLYKAMDIDLEKNLLSLFYVYLSDFTWVFKKFGFEENTYRTKVLRNLLGKKFRQNINFRRKKVNKIKASYDYFFKDDSDYSDIIFVGNINKNGVLGAFESVGISHDYYATNFVKRIIALYFNLTSDINKAVVEIQAISENGLWKEVYFLIASYLIPKVQEDNHKQILITIFNKAFGDPRIGAKSGWVNVSQKAREIFLSWLTKQDLIMFFEVISKTNSSDMWWYRSRFWLSYLPHIKNAWMFLGSDATSFIQIYCKAKCYYGKLWRAPSNKSIFIFEIGDYVFCEGSDNAKLRIWRKGEAPIKIGATSVTYNEIIYSPYILADFVHNGSQNHTWQDKVGDWIYDNCHVIP